MKVIILIAISMSFSINTFGKEITLRRLDALERKVAELEAKINILMNNSSNKTTLVNGLKMKDGNNSIQQVDQGRSISSGNSSSITEEKKNEIMKQIDQFKKNRAESQKILDEIMNENY